MIPPVQLNDRVNEVRWSSRSCGNPGCTDPECVCGLCAQPIGTPEEVLAQNGHDPECFGCPMCNDQVPICLFRGVGADVRGAAFHAVCFEKLLVVVEPRK